MGEVKYGTELPALVDDKGADRGRVEWELFYILESPRREFFRDVFGESCDGLGVGGRDRRVDNGCETKGSETTIVAGVETMGVTVDDRFY